MDPAPPAGVEVIETTADVGLELRGGTLADVFLLALAGFSYLTIGEVVTSAETWRDVELDSDTIPELLVAWLQWALVQFDADGWIPARAELELRGRTLRARVGGTQFSALNNSVWYYLKGVSYHRLDVCENSDGTCVARVLFDV